LWVDYTNSIIPLTSVVSEGRPPRATPAIPTMDRVTRPVTLFTLAAAGFVVVSLFRAIKEGRPPITLHINGGFAVGHASFFLVSGAICGLFALLYFGYGQFIRVPLNRGLSLANFILILSSLFVLILPSPLFGPQFWLGADSRANERVQLTGDASATCFLVGCSLFVINVIWTLAQSMRPTKPHPNH